MIRAVREADLRLSVTGHANSAPYGRDLICAAVSILLYTLADRVTNQGSVKIKEGDSIIQGDASGKDGKELKISFDTICAGLEMLAAKYPDFVFYEDTRGV